MLFLIGGLIQINPIWQYGPFHPYLSENGAQPDWYIGWLIGALRLVPNFEPVIAGHTIIPNPFWGGAFSPLVVFGIMFAWPALERRFTKDRRRHDLLDRPRDHPTRTAIGAAFLSWVVMVFAVGSTNRIFYRLHISYTAQIHFWRVGIWVLPIIIFFITRSGARALQRSEAHPLRGWQGQVVTRAPDGHAQTAQPSQTGDPPAVTEPPVERCRPRLPFPADRLRSAHRLTASIVRSRRCAAGRATPRHASPSTAATQSGARDTVLLAFPRRLVTASSTRSILSFRLAAPRLFHERPGPQHGQRRPTPVAPRGSERGNAS